MERLTNSNYKNDKYYLNCDECTKNDCTECPKILAVFARLADYEDTGLEPEQIQTVLDDAAREFVEYDAMAPKERLRELAQADRMIGKEVWAQAKYLNIFQTKPSLIQRTTIQYVSLLKGGDILCHTQTCAFPLNEVGKTVFLTREEAQAALRREQE